MREGDMWRKKGEESRYNMYKYESVDYSIGDVWHIVWEQNEGIWLACLSMIVNMKKETLNVLMMNMLMLIYCV